VGDRKTGYAVHPVMLKKKCNVSTKWLSDINV